jgi:hypothetical protein
MSQQQDIFGLENGKIKRFRCYFAFQFGKVTQKAGQNYGGQENNQLPKRKD